MNATRASLVCLLGATAAWAGTAEVDRLQPISTDLALCPAGPLGPIYPEAEWQPQIRVHPADGNRLAVVWTQGFFASAGIGVSTDGGETWTQHQAPISICGGGTGGVAADPWLAWATDGTALFQPCCPFALGNYFGLTPMSGGFGAAFTMAASQASEPSSDVFFARLKPGN